jgi:ATPase subunit of ABC transporter with duplicated ATPase domains
VKLKKYQNQQKKIDQMEQQIQRFRIWGEMRDSAKMFKHAKELEKRLEKIDPLSRPQLNKRKIRLNQNQVGRSGKIVLTADTVSKSFGDRTILENVDFTIFYQDSACIIGENGSGKTTLLKMILGELEPDKGSIKLGAQIIIGYLPQQVEYLDEEQTVLEYFASLHNITNGAARAQLAKVLFFNEDVNKKIKFLSGGEKSRLKLCSLTFEGVNFLILDEPTNHLDIDSREVLEETLSDFDGTILFVSHDRYFINKVADKIIAIENNTMQFYAGDYNYYLEESAKTKEKLPQILQPDEKTVQAKNMMLRKEINDFKSMNNGKATNVKSSRKLEFIEQDIERLEEEIKELDDFILQYCFDSEKLGELFLEKTEVKAKLEQAYEEWEKLQLQE